MPNSVHITTPWPTSEQLAGVFGITSDRQSELNAMAEKIASQWEDAGQSAGDNALAQEEKPEDASAAD